jgi:hypothetical protein
MEKRVNRKLKAKEAKTLKVTKKEAADEPAPSAPPAGPPKVDLKTFDFPVNSKYVSGNVLYTVSRVRKDSNTEWRTVLSANHGDQDYMLDTIRKDALRDPTFVVVDIGTPSPK